MSRRSLTGAGAEAYVREAHGQRRPVVVTAAALEVVRLLDATRTRLARAEATVARLRAEVAMTTPARTPERTP